MIKDILNAGIKIVTSDQVPEDAVFLLGRVKLVRHVFLATGEVVERLQWDPEECSLISNIGGSNVER